MTNRDALRQRFAEMRALEKGWYYGSGEPVPLPVIEWVEEWLSRDDEDFDGWRMYPTQEGGVHMERQTLDESIVFDDTVRVSADRIVHCRGTRHRGGDLSTTPWLLWVWMEHALAPPHELLDLDVRPTLGGRDGAR